MNRTDAIRLEVRRLQDLQLAAVRYASVKSTGNLIELGAAAVAWTEAADTVLDAILREAEGRPLTAEETKDVENVVPRIRIVKGDGR